MENEYNEDIDSLNNEVEDTQNLEDTNEGETVETEPEIDVAQLQATNKKLFERAKKAEAELKLAKQTKPAQAQQQASPTNIEETVLLANGMNEELLEQLKKVAQVQGVSLIKAQNDPIFVAVKEKFEKDKKQELASMPVSRGSGASKPKKTFNTPGLTEAERKEMFESRFNR